MALYWISVVSVVCATILQLTWLDLASVARILQNPVGWFISNPII